MPRGRLVRTAAVPLVLAMTAVAAAACSPDAAPSAHSTSEEAVSSVQNSRPIPPSEDTGSAHSTEGGGASNSATATSSVQKLSPAQQAALDEQLRDAAWANDVGRARALVAQGADVNAKDRTVQSAYLIATSEGHLDLLRLTLANGATVDDKDSWNGTGLIRAAERGHYLVVGELLQAGIDRDHVNRIGYQAIHEAVWLGRNSTAYVDTVRVLVAGGVELTRQSGGERLTPLDMARQRGHDRLEDVLVKTTTAGRIADPDAELLRAAEAGDADRVALALRAGADIGARDARQRTALQLAATSDRADTTRLLVAMGGS